MKILFLAICLLIMNIVGFGQFEKSKLKNWLQQNYDTTIAVYNYSSWSQEFNLKIIAKNENNIDFFSYQNPYSFYRRDNKHISGMQQTELSAEYSKTEAGNNKYLKKHSTVSPTQNEWKIINSTIWRAESEPLNYIYSEDTSGKRSYFIINDGPQYIIYLLSKHDVTALHFYAPAHLEEHSPGNFNRQAAIKVMEILEKYCR
ncbi:hypothetical protein ACFSPU_10705 [Haoranjiania flava]|uniref:Uncharacterized protein n=1 Tax=Haoranjiania flava TaxID=1856322 RepID=A0AAE3LQ99_9BACT|nr:hypothetical protein [Haoranjiania flava]MCU7694320.1 hypothetical protein [Haoranjiania flava]